MTPTITLLYAVLLTIWLLVLSVRVITFRRQNLVEIGAGEGRTLEFRMRAQGNLTEYAPIALLLMALLEMNGLPDWALHGLGLMFLAGRLAHGWSFSFANGHMRFRVIGMVLTLTMLGIAIVSGAAVALF
ncbi:MAG: MAPEG family protein [Paracoccaceae bacterium]